MTVGEMPQNHDEKCGQYVTGDDDGDETRTRHGALESGGDEHTRRQPVNESGKGTDDEERPDQSPDRVIEEVGLTGGYEPHTGLVDHVHADHQQRERVGGEELAGRANHPPNGRLGR